jgi:predicted proteasome-type protease
VLVYGRDELAITRHRRFGENDPELRDIHLRWEQALRRAVLELPELRFPGAAEDRRPPASGSSAGEQGLSPTQSERPS